MKHETKTKLKAQLLAEAMEKSANCLASMGGDPGPREANSWEGVMTMLSGIMREKSYDEAAAAIMAASAWVWAHKEHCMREEIARVEELIQADAEANEAEAGAAAGKGVLK